LLKEFTVSDESNSGISHNFFSLLDRPIIQFGCTVVNRQFGYLDLNQLSPLFDLHAIYTTQDPPVKNRFHFPIPIGRSLDEIVARSDENLQNRLAPKH
jgi:hypothetical protein